MASDSAFTHERLTALRFGETATVGPYDVTLKGVKPVVGENWSAIAGVLIVKRGTDRPFVMEPQQRFFSTPPTTTNESAIVTRWNGQLYTVLGQQNADGRWQVRLWWKPFVTLIWIGGAMIALGGLLALIGHMRRTMKMRRRAREYDEWAEAWL